MSNEHLLIFVKRNSNSIFINNEYWFHLIHKSSHLYLVTNIPVQVVDRPRCCEDEERLQFWQLWIDALFYVDCESFLWISPLWQAEPNHRHAFPLGNFLELLILKVVLQITTIFLSHTVRQTNLKIFEHRVILINLKFIISNFKIISIKFL